MYNSNINLEGSQHEDQGKMKKVNIVCIMNGSDCCNLGCCMQDLLHWAHSQPHKASVWYLSAAAALHYAASTHQAAAYSSALALCKHALHLLNSYALHPQGNNHDQTNGQTPQQPQQQQHDQQNKVVKLHCMMSECQLHIRRSQDRSSEQAMSSAKDAVQTASGCQDSELIAVALQQISR